MLDSQATPSWGWRFLTTCCPLLHWLSQRAYRMILAESQDHPLVHLQRELAPAHGPGQTLAALAAACARLSHPRCPVIGLPTARRLLRALSRSELYGWPLPDLAHEIRVNALVKWFTGYPLYERGPDAATLHSFAAQVNAHHLAAALHGLALELERTILASSS